MMKRSSSFLLLLVFLGSFGKAQPYSFQNTTAVYTDLSGDISLNQNMVWDDPWYTIPVGFPFSFFGATYNNLVVYDFGCAFGQMEDTILVVYGADLIDRGYDNGTSVSPISYKLEGSSPNRILKIQWKNAGFYEEYDTTGSYSWYANIQLWIHESGIFETRYGANSIGDITIAFYGETGAFIGFGEEMDSWFLTGLPTAPVLSHFTNGNYGNLTGVPADGTLYRFTPGNVGIEEGTPLSVSIRNSGGTMLLGTNIPVGYTLLNMAGQVMTKGKLIPGDEFGTLSGSYPAGVYLLRVSDDQGRADSFKVLLW